MTVAVEARPVSTGNRRSDRRLAFVLVAPAAMLMLAVTAYPICYAVWLSLQRNNLATPNEIGRAHV
jgi:multiple sugar transport system permease protein